MSDPKGPGRDFDLTTPNIQLPAEERYGRQGPPAGDFDHTMVNRPSAPAAQPSAPPSARNFDLTSVNMGVPADVDADEDIRPAPPQAPIAPAVQQQQFVQAPQPVAKAKRRVPIWAIVLGAVVALLGFLIVAGVISYFLLRPSGFTLRVVGTPPGTQVYVDDVAVGVPQADGTIEIKGLRSDTQREVRVTHEGFCDFRTTVKGTRGEVQEISPKLAPCGTQTAAATEPASEIDYNGRMVLIPAGAFIMGDNSHGPEEKPEHSVELPAYYIDKNEVTNEQYKKFCDAANHAPPINPFWDPQYFQNNPKQPVLGITFSDAQAYAQWANKRLPTEEEWEKAAGWDPKAKKKRQWPWGDSADPTRANVGTDHPKDVGSYPTGASAYGVNDMVGNAEEWVDAFFQAYTGSQAKDPRFGTKLRVTRGGSFRGALNALARTTSRNAVDPSHHTIPEDATEKKSSLLGFRCAVAADDPKLKAFLEQQKNK